MSAASARSRCLAAAALGALALSHTSLARAGNLDTFFASGEGMLQGGAVTASAHGGGAVWYNPAGLARLPGLRLDVSVNAFSLRLGGHPDLDPAPGGRAQRLETLDFNVVPAALAVARRFGPIGAGFGVFVPVQQTTFLRTRLVVPVQSAASDVELGLDYYRRFQDYLAGPAFGIELHPKLDLGASLLVHYRSELATGASNIIVPGIDAEGGASLVIHETLDWQQVGAQLALGMQIHVQPSWDLGFGLRLPSLRLFQLRQEVTMQSVLANEAPSPGQFDEDSGPDSAVIAPARVHAGVAHRHENGQWGLDVSYQLAHRYQDQALRVDWAPTLNARVGVKFHLAEDLSVGGGLFTDRSPERVARELGDAKLDFYGLNVAVDFGTRYRAVVEGAQASSPPTLLRFGTTVGVSYAVGPGTVVRGALGDLADPSGGFNEVPTRTVAHELTVQIASTLLN